MTPPPLPSRPQAGSGPATLTGVKVGKTWWVGRWAGSRGPERGWRRGIWGAGAPARGDSGQREFGDRAAGTLGARAGRRHAATRSRGRARKPPRGGGRARAPGAGHVARLLLRAWPGGRGLSGGHTGPRKPSGRRKRGGRAGPWVRRRGSLMEPNVRFWIAERHVRPGPGAAGGGVALGPVKSPRGVAGWPG